MQSRNNTSKETKSAKNTLISNLVKINMSNQQSVAAACMICEIGNGNGVGL